MRQGSPLAASNTHSGWRPKRSREDAQMSLQLACIQPADVSGTWFVDASLGSDNSDGKSAGAGAFKTTEKLSQTLCPNGTQLVIGQNVTVSIAAGTYKRLSLNLAALEGSGFNFTINCAFTSTADMLLTGVVNTSSATLTRGQLTVSSGAFSAQCRIRSTSGANIGAICYSTGQNANAQN